MIVHCFARRTLFDPMHDGHTFCQNFTESIRTTVRFLGQQNEVKIDDTWPRMGMRSLWKRTTSFWTQGMPPDDTWEPEGHHSEIRQLFRNNLNRTAGAMRPPFVNTVTQTEHGRRGDSSLPVMSHAEGAKEKGRCVVLGLSELSHVSSTNHDDSSCHSTSKCCY